MKMLSKMFYIGVLTPACITVACFIMFLICWYKCGLKERFLRKLYPEHFKKSDPNMQFMDLTFRNRNFGFTERDTPETDEYQLSTLPSDSYETMTDSHSAAESDHSSASISSTQKMLEVGSKGNQRRSQPHFEIHQKVIPNTGETAIYGVQQPDSNCPTPQHDQNINKHVQKIYDNRNDTASKQSSQNRETSISVNKNVTQEWIKNYRCSSLEDHYKHCIIGIHNSDIKKANYVPGNYVSSSYPKGPENVTRGQQYLHSQTTNYKGYHIPPPPDVTYSPSAHHQTHIPQRLSKTYGMFVIQQNYPTVHKGQIITMALDTDSEYNKDYITSPYLK